MFKPEKKIEIICWDIALIVTYVIFVIISDASFMSTCMPILSTCMLVKKRNTPSASEVAISAFKSELLGVYIV